jgi:hypothetical protein
MATAYPGAIDNFTNPTSSDTLNSVTVPHATQHSNLNDAVEAIEATLGIDPQGGSATVVARLNANDTAVGLKAPLASPTLVTPVLGVASATDVTLSGKLAKSATNAITASATQTQGGATALTTDINRITVVATADDAVKLPAATAGRQVTVINTVNEQVGVFPASGDAINALGADTVSPLAALTTRTYTCAVAGTWNF